MHKLSVLVNNPERFHHTPMEHFEWIVRSGYLSKSIAASSIRKTFKKVHKVLRFNFLTWHELTIIALDDMRLTDDLIPFPTKAPWSSTSLAHFKICSNLIEPSDMSLHHCVTITATFLTSSVLRRSNRRSPAEFSPSSSLPNYCNHCMTHQYQFPLNIWIVISSFK